MWKIYEEDQIVRRAQLVLMDGMAGSKTGS